jgi:dihydrodipicolinate synthase/N-acetylneuraminate lyase
VADSDLGFRRHLLEGQVIPAHPLALTARRKLDERRQRALTRYYLASGAGGVAVGVHTTQFAIRGAGLYRPVLELAAHTVNEELALDETRAFSMIAGVVGDTNQAVAEAEVARSLGYHAALLSLGGSHWTDATDAVVLRHCKAVGEVMPLFGFYLQPAVGGRTFSYRFWRELAELPALVAVKIAPFNRYQTLDVVRAIAECGRDDVALYTGNDDSIVHDLLTPYEFSSGGRAVERRIAGGLLGQWAVWTSNAVEMLDGLKAARARDSIPSEWLAHAARLTDANGAIFDAANGFRGCIAGIHEVLRRQGLLSGVWCLNPHERLSDGQSAEIERVMRAYPELCDDEFVAANLDSWMR